MSLGSVGALRSPRRPKGASCKFSFLFKFNGAVRGSRFGVDFFLAIWLVASNKAGVFNRAFSKRRPRDVRVGRECAASDQ